MRINYIESNIEGDIDLKNQFKINNLPCPLENSDADCKFYVDSGLNDPIKKRNTASLIKILIMLDLLKYIPYQLFQNNLRQIFTLIKLSVIV